MDHLLIKIGIVAGAVLFLVAYFTAGLFAFRLLMTGSYGF